MKKLLFLLLLFTSFIYAQPPINNPTPYIVCDDNNDGLSIFDLNTKNAEILGVLNPLLFTVTYHSTFGESENGNNPLETNYYNYNPLNEVIYVRVMENNNPSNFATTTLDLIVNIPPNINQPTNLIQNDSPYDGIGLFDLTSLSSTILGSLNTSVYNVTFYTSLVNAQMSNNVILNPSSFNNTINPQTIYAKINGDPLGCNPITNFDLIVSSNSLSIVNPTQLEVCDINGDGYANFDLTLKNSEILGSLSSSDYTVSYHATFGDANGNVNPIVDITNYANNFPPETIFPRVQENLNSANFSTTTLLLIANASPFMFGVPIQNFFEYDSPYDGVATFDLTTNQAVLLGLQTGINVTYHTSENDAQAVSNAIINPTSYEGSHLQTIWVAFQNVSGCVVYSSFILKVYDTNDIVFIPDANFKNALLTLNSTFAFSSGGTLEQVDIDTNNDGEIQVGETEPIIGLNVMNANIVNLTGIESFTNLSYFDCTNNQVTNLNLISSLTSLKTLNCIGSGLTSLNVSTLINLEYLTCYGNQITSLDLSNCPNLIRVDCNNNQLNSLILGPSTTFNHLDCSNNSLTTLDVSMLTNLEVLLSKQNQLTTIDLSSNASLQHLQCGSPTTFNSIDVSNLVNLKNLEIIKSTQTSLDLTANTLLQEVDISETNITALDFSNVTLTSSFVGYNPNLEYLNIKNGGISFIGINTCPNLLYVCTDENEIIPILNNLTNPLYNNNPNVQVNSYCTFVPGGDFNTITGKITYDLTNNGCDLLDDAKPLNKVKIDDGVNIGYAFTNELGFYTFHTLTGNFTITPELENADFFTISPVNTIVNFTNNNNNIETRDFCITQNGVFNDLEIVINPLYFEFNGNKIYQLVYKNKGNQILSGTINFSYDDTVSDIMASSPAFNSQDVNALLWNFSNLLPFESKIINLELSFNSATDTPPLNPGDVLTYSAIINPIVGDQTPTDNYFTLNETIENNSNPNRIICLEGNSLSPILAGEPLHYNVYFENIGSEQVDNVVVKCVIDTTKFDIDSLQLINASNEIQTRVTNNVIEFIFENANLALRTGSPPVGGHGNVLFKINTLDDLVAGDQIGVLAQIYFDYDAPIVTNMAETTFITLNNAIFEFDNSVTIYPNPTSSKININSDFTIKSIELYDVQGRVLVTQIGNSKSLDISDKTNGIYFVKITTEKGSKVEKIVKE